MPTPNRYWNTAWGAYLDLTQEVGITSTPVIDRETLTHYFTTVTWGPSVTPRRPTSAHGRTTPKGRS